MDIGSKIKYYRTKNQITQEELASGIISVSYLSKIENNQVESNMNIISLLCERLDITPNLPIDSNIPEVCEGFIEALLTRSFEEAESFYIKLNNEIESVSHYGFLKLFEIHKVRYFLLKKDISSAGDQINLLKRQRFHFTKKEEFYWFKFLANYHYLNSDFSIAFDYYKKAKKIFNFDIYFYEEEESDLNYSLSISASKLWNTYLSINYATEALGYYQRKYNLRRCIECHIVLGISYGRNKEYTEAVACYKQAKKLSSTIQSTWLYSVCEQNLGHLLSLQGKQEQAIQHFLSCFKSRKETDVSILNPIFSLTKEYYALDDLTNAKKWVEKGQIIIHDLNLINSSQYIDFKVYSYLITNYSAEFELFMLETVIPFYEGKNNDMELAKNLRILAKYYYDDRKYKKSSICYDRAYKLLESI